MQFKDREQIISFIKSIGCALELKGAVYCLFDDPYTFAIPYYFVILTYAGKTYKFSDPDYHVILRQMIKLLETISLKNIEKNCKNN